MSKVSGNNHSSGQMNHHANQNNPNNGVYRSKCQQPQQPDESE
ncbi:hypothetical protein [uncultured Succinivibrio sp.]|nr:hypothetical protein [uncultured Succinivibrio sp.]